MNIAKRLWTTVLALLVAVSVAFGAEQSLFERAKAALGTLTVELFATDEMIYEVLERVVDDRRPDGYGAAFDEKTYELRQPARDVIDAHNKSGDYTEPTDFHVYSKIGNHVRATARGFLNDPAIVSALYEEKLPVVREWLAAHEGDCVRKIALMRAKGRIWTCQSASVILKQGVTKFRDIFSQIWSYEHPKELIRSYLNAEYLLQYVKVEADMSRADNYHEGVLEDEEYVSGIVPDAKRGWYNGHTQGEADYWKAREDLEAHFKTDYETVLFVYRFQRALSEPALDMWVALMDRFVEEL